MKGRLFDPTIGRFISADPYVQSPLWGQGLNRYSYGYNNPMSGSDPSGYGWLDKVFGDSSGYEGSAFFAGGLGITGGAYLSTLSTVGQFSGLGGAIGIGQAAYGLNDPGANAKYARPTGELGSGAVGSQGGLYNEGAGMAPAGAQGATACYPGCLPDPRSAFPNTPIGEAQYQAWLDGVWISGNAILAAEGLVSVGSALGRWLLGRAAVRGGSVGAMSAGENLLNWAWKSKPTWRHTFLHHGQGAKITKSLADTARTAGPQGQWLNNEAAAQFLAAQRPYIQGPTSMAIPKGLGQVVLPNGSVVPATRATLVPSANGGFVTAYPIP